MCEFCNIIDRKKPVKLVHESDKVIAFLDMDPISTGHVLVLPKYHADSLTKIPQEYLIEVFDTARRIVEVFENDYHHSGYSIMQNGGHCCDFGHFHLHVFPRVPDDGFGWKYPEVGGLYMDAVAEDLREKMQKYESWGNNKGNRRNTKK